MQSILSQTTVACKEKMEAYDARADNEGAAQGAEAEAERTKQRHLALMNASEVTVPRFVKEIIDPPNLERFEPRAVASAGARVQEDEEEVA